MHLLRSPLAATLIATAGLVAAVVKRSLLHVELQGAHMHLN